MGRRTTNEYVVYKGDEVICAGTAKEIQLKLNMTETQFRNIASTRTLERDKVVKNLMVAVKVPLTEIVGVSK